MIKINETTTKNDDNIIAAIAYLLCPLSSIIIYLMEKDKPDKRRFVMFHAMQSFILGIALIAIGSLFPIIAVILAIILNIIPLIGGIISGLLMMVPPIIILVILVIIFFMIYKSFSGEEYHLPVIGNMAEKYI
ncbi:MAG: hypothetical protein K8R25_06265 [Methanosarcinales archaeon]|nr:hypothetical protein [Methanosarcinales archaeon]